MKRIIISSFLLFLTMSLSGQSVDMRKKIEVSGSAEMKIIPDEIFLGITLREYKEGNKKIGINQLEQELVKAIEIINIDKSNLRVANIGSYDWNSRRKKNDLMAVKKFQLKVDKVNKVNELFEKLDSKGITNVTIDNYGHSEIAKFRKQVKISAIQAAKEKAKFLLDTIGENLGGVLQVNEVDNGDFILPRGRLSNTAVVHRAAPSYDYKSELEFMTMNIRYEISAIFEIK